MPKPVVVLCCLFLSLLSIASCTTVEPWERGRLAKQEMGWQQDPLIASLKEQIYFSKEASSGGGKSAGGGCGCN